MNRDTPHDAVSIDVPLVLRLVADQFPQWAGLTIRPVATDGHDNRTFHLGDEMSVRLPSARRYASHVRIEHQWLPKIGHGLPLPVPVPLGQGRPGMGYPWPWSVNRWIHGETISAGGIPDPCEFAEDLARFLNALQSIDATDAPSPGAHNFHRGGDLSVYDSQSHECIRVLQDAIDVGAAASVWRSALEATWDRPPVWLHGDVAPGNLLASGGRLCAVIDFGQLAAGDPSCDATIAWNALLWARSRGLPRHAERGRGDLDSWAGMGAVEGDARAEKAPIKASAESREGATSHPRHPLRLEAVAPPVGARPLRPECVRCLGPLAPLDTALGRPGCSQHGTFLDRPLPHLLTCCLLLVPPRILFSWSGVRDRPTDRDRLSSSLWATHPRQRGLPAWRRP